MLRSLATRTLSTVVVVIAVLFALPVAQLPTVSIEQHCCCPSPETCHCPSDLAGHGTHESIRPCHHTTEITVLPTLAGFTQPAAADLAPHPALVATIVYAPRILVDERLVRRPDAPS